MGGSCSCDGDADKGDGQELQLMSEKAVYNLIDARSLRDFIVDSNIRLVRAEYLWKLTRKGKRVLRRQETESELCEDGRSALVTHAEMRAWRGEQDDALIMSVSHCWESREHPDPCGHQLEQVAKATMMYHLAYGVPIWLFVDYMSLFQYKRSEGEQELSFRAAMNNMHVFYAHDSTYTLRVEGLTPAARWEKCKDERILIFHEPSGGVVPVPVHSLTRNDTPYEERGWCRAELEWSSCRKESWRNVRIDGDPGARPGTDSGANMASDFKGRVPRTPGDFAAGVGALKFTHRSDLEPVIRLQAKIYHEKVADCEVAAFENLSGAEVLRLASALPDFRKLRSLTLRHIECDEQQAAKLMQAMHESSVTDLEFVELLELEIALPVAKAVAEILKAEGSSLRRLAFRDCLDFYRPSRFMRGKDLAEELAEAVAGNAALRELSLANCLVGDAGAEAFARALGTNRALRSFKLEGKANDLCGVEDEQGGWKFDIGDRGAQALARALEGNASLTALGLGHQRIMDKGVQALQEAVRKNHTVERIDLWGRYVRMTAEQRQHLGGVFKLDESEASDGGDAGGPGRLLQPQIPVLAERLRANAAVATWTQLNLGGSLKAQAVKALADFLKVTVNTTLRIIRLAENGLGDEGVQALAEALKVNTTIREINLRDNNIGPAGAEALAEALKVNKTVQKINLSHNIKIGDAGVKALAEALRINTTLQEIELLYTTRGDAGREALAKLQEARPGLRIRDAEVRSKEVSSEEEEGSEEVYEE